MLGIERVGHIVIRVSDMDAGMAFYRDKLGMEVTSYRPGRSVFLSFGSQDHDIALFQDAGDGVHGALGLVHIALRIPGDDHDLRTAYDKLKASGVQVDQVEPRYDAQRLLPRPRRQPPRDLYGRLPRGGRHGRYA